MRKRSAAGDGAVVVGSAPRKHELGEGPQFCTPRTWLRSAEFVQAVARSMSPIELRASACNACGLSKVRTNVVFGAGTATSGIVFIGEAPGANEDITGLPFVGRSGRLLDELLAEVGIERADVYICNVVKCRPPANREPKPEEVASCAHFLSGQLATIQPRVLCALGLHAARWLIATTRPMSELRGKVMDHKGIATLATYHPAAILRNPGLRPKAQEDFKLLRMLADDGGSRECIARS